MDLRGFEDELINEGKEKKCPTTLKDKKILVAGRFTEANKIWPGNDNDYINTKYSLTNYITKHKGSVVTKLNNEVDIVCWLVPYTITKIVQKAKKLNIPILKYTEFLMIGYN